MEPTQQLIDHIEQSKIDLARRQSFAEKFLAGAALFDYACEISMAGIRAQHPDYDEDQVRHELRRRLAIGRRVEEIAG